MKLTIRFRMLIIALLLLTTFTYAQDDKPVITLTVNADEVTQENTDTTCSFGQAANISNEDFLTLVRVGYEVKWKIDRIDGNNNKVKLVKFKHDNGSKFFGVDSIPERNGRIKGTVVANAGNPGDEEKYTIFFEVKKDGGVRDTIYIDPKLKMQE